jgi:hypothetical protein
MSRIRSRDLALAALAIAGALLILDASITRADCSYTTLTSTLAVQAPSTPRFYSFGQVEHYWSAVGVRSLPGEDWDLAVFSATGPDPTCVSGLLKSSVRTTGVDFVIGDFNYGADPLGTSYARVSRFAGSGPATVQWDDGADDLPPNLNGFVGATGPDHVVKVWDSLLRAGKTYTIYFEPPAGGGLKLLLFRNPAESTPYWASRNDAVFEVTGTTTYTAPADDYYAIVVVNDTGVSGSYALAIGTCEPARTLTSSAPEFNLNTGTPGQFTQTEPYFTAIGLRGYDAGDNWELSVWHDLGGSYPFCVSNPVASSFEPAGRADVVVGDFNGGANPVGTYYVRAYPSTPVQVVSTTEWDDGPDQLQIGDPPIKRATNANDVVEIWDVFLQAGQSYVFDFLPLPGATLRMLLFHNPGAAYWVGRAAADVEAAGTITYTAPATDWYGVAVVNDDGGTSSYELGVSTCTQPVALSSDAYQLAPLASGSSLFGYMHAKDSLWCAVGVRDQNPDGDWDLVLWDQPSGGATPLCASNSLSISQGSPPAEKVDFIVSDGTRNPAGWFFPEARPYGSFALGDAWVEWDEGELLAFAQPPITRHFTSRDVLDAYTISLVAGTSYTFFFAPDPGLGAQLFLFRNTTDPIPYYAARDLAEWSDVDHHDYAAPATGTYALIVANENGVDGNYRLRFGPINTAVGDGIRPNQARLREVRPNPAHGSVRLVFDLQAPAPVGFVILDLAGRVVARVPASARGAGTWEEVWDGRDSDGKQLAAGVYFARMDVAGAPGGLEKIVLVR